MSASSRAAEARDARAPVFRGSGIPGSDRLTSLLAQGRDLGIPWERILRQETGCSREDGEWAVARANAAGLGHRLNDCMDRARGEGFEIPQAVSEFEALALLRKFVKRVFPQKNNPSGSRRLKAASYEVTVPPGL